MKLPWRHKKIYIYPNRFGFLFFGLFCLSIMVGGAYNNNLIFLMGFILISFLFVTILLTAKNLKEIEISGIQISPGFPKEIVPVKVTVSNNSDLEHTSLHLQLDQFPHQGVLHHIGPNDRSETTMSLKLPDQRGVYELGHVKVSTQNPFGLFYSWFWFRITTEYLVYPKPTGSKERSRQEQQHGDEFSGLKEYEEGDPMSRISWKHMAKNNQMLVKQFNDSELREDLLDIREARQPDFEDKLSQMALWLLEAEKDQRLYALELGAGQTNASRGPKHLHECLDQLARAEAA